jgi:negative regulator of flagellin synthesis FlgM
MKIGSFEAKSVVPAPASERKTGSASAGTAAESSAKVAFSPTAELLVGPPSADGFDARKVDRIATAIREGKFQVNPEAIADKLIVTAEELLGRKLS